MLQESGKGLGITEDFVAARMVMVGKQAVSPSAASVAARKASPPAEQLTLRPWK